VVTVEGETAQCTCDGEVLEEALNVQGMDGIGI